MSQSQIRIGSAGITGETAFAAFDDPIRELPLRLEYDDFPLLLDFLNGVDWDRRRAVRVPVRAESGLSTTVERSGESYLAEAIDISLVGILIELDKEPIPDLSVDDNVSVVLHLDELHATLSGIVRRCDWNHYGIVFPASLRREKLAPPIGLRQIVNQLEADWLARSIQGKREDELKEVTIEVGPRPA